MIVHRSTRAALLAAAAAVLLARPVRGEDQASGGGGTGGSASSSPAEAALQQMSRTLASAPTMRFNVRTLRPVKLEDGRWITLVGGAAVTREGKDKLRVETSGDFYHFQLYFDGTTLTAYAPGDRIYAQEGAPETIDDVLARAESRGQAAFEFRDLISADPYSAMTRGLMSAVVVGTSTVEGVETQHIAVHASTMDWEIWIGTGDHLPRMVTITDLGDARKPTDTLLLSDWTVGGAIPAEAFTFVAPSDATRVPFRDPRQRVAGREASSGTATGGAP